MVSHDTVTVGQIEAEVLAHAERLNPRVEIDPASSTQLPKPTLNAPSPSQAEASQEWADADRVGLDQAREALASPSVKVRMCAALGSVSDDLKELAKPLSKVLLPVSAASGTAATAAGLSFTVSGIPMTVIGAAIISLMISRAGIAAYCAGLDTE